MVLSNHFAVEVSGPRGKENYVHKRLDARHKTAPLGMRICGRMEREEEVFVATFYSFDPRGNKR